MSKYKKDQQNLPLFYRKPRPLSSEAHQSWRLLPGDYGFAAETSCVPLVAGEFIPASHHYPILFALGDAVTPVALLAIERDNLFVTEGKWTEDIHIPAYVRRYPFGFGQTGEEDKFLLVIDEASDYLAKKGAEGQALFADGEPTELTMQALQFCEIFRADALYTADFCAAVQAQDLLTERRADVTLPDGRTFGVDGFAVIDKVKLDALDDALLAQWHRKGWLALVEFHFASLHNFTGLLARQAARSAQNLSASAEAA